jgi:hypothetical protein
MRKNYFRYSATISIMCIALASASCGGSGGEGGSGGGGDTVSIKATLDGSYQVAHAPTLLDPFKDFLFGKPALALSSGAVVDRVVAVPTYQGHYGPSFLEMMKSADVANDGGFSLALDRNYEWVLLLVNSQAATASEKVAGYVAATVDADDTLIAFSGSQLSSNLDLGTLGKTGDEAKSSSSGSENVLSFDLSLDQLVTLAKSDGGYKHLINLYLNYDPVTEISYIIQPDFNWSAGTISGSTTAPVGADIATYQAPEFSLTVETNDLNNPTKEGICGIQQTIGLFPPGPIGDGVNTWSGTDGFANDGSGPLDTGQNNLGSANSGTWLDEYNGFYCYDDDFSMQQLSGATTRLIGFDGRNNNLLQVPVGGFPEGMWQLKVAGTTVAEFDLAVGSPVNAGGKFDTIPLPAIKVDYNASTGAITQLQVTWFQYDASSGQYTELTSEQRQAFEASYLVSDTFIEIQDEDGPNPSSSPETVSFFPGDPPSYQNKLVTGLDMTSASNTWCLPGSTGDTTGNLVPTHIRIAMHMGGALYSFSWN